MRWYPMNVLGKTRLLQALALIAVFCGSTFAGGKSCVHGRTGDGSPLPVSGNLDGYVDTATIRLCGATYQIDVRFAKQPARIHLTLPVRNQIGLGLTVLDIDQDADADLVLTSAASLNPVAVWLNTGKGAFQRTYHSFGPLLGADGAPHVRSGEAPNTDQDILSSSDPLSEVVLPGQLNSACPAGTRVRGQDDSLSLIAIYRSSASPRSPPDLTLL